MLHSRPATPVNEGPSSPSSKTRTPLNKTSLLDKILTLQLLDSHVAMLQAISPILSDDNPLHHLVSNKTCVQTYTYQNEDLRMLDNLYQEWLSNNERDISPLEIAKVKIDQIVKINFMLLTANGKKETNRYSTYSIVVEISQKSKEKSIYILPFTYSNILRDLSLLLNIAPENAFKLPSEELISDSEWTGLAIYDEETTSIYEAIHAEIANAAFDLLISQVVPKTPIIIIDIGTGTGKALHSIQQKIDPHFMTRPIGIDLNETNITLAKNNFPQYSFYQVNAEDIANFAQDNIPLAHPDSVNPFVLVIASGFLTRKVTANTIAAANILQQFSRFADAAIIASITDVLFTKRIAKRIGWLPQILCNRATAGSEKVTYVLRKNSTVPQLFSQHLDLSLHGNPQELVQYRLLKASKRTSEFRLKDITTLDLGLAHICHLKEIVNLLNCLPKLRTIYVSGKENWYSDLISYLKEKDSRIKVISNPNYYLTNQELNTFSHQKQRRLFKQLGLYKPTLTHLKERATARPDVYSPPSAENKQSPFISKLERLVKEFDDETALYVLATMLSSKDIKDHRDIEANKAVEADLIKASHYLRRLMQKGYPDLIDQLRGVMDKIIQLQSNQNLRPN